MNEYNSLFISALDRVKNTKKISFKSQAEALGWKIKEIYNIRQGIKIVTKKELENFLELFELEKEDIIESLDESNVEYSYKSNPYKKLSKALEENNKYLKEKVERLELENSQLKAEIYKIKNG